MIFATKFTEKLSDPNKTKEHHDLFFKNKT